AVANRELSALKLKLTMRPVCPEVCARFCPVSASQSHVEPSLEPVATVRPSGLKHDCRNSPGWGIERSSLPVALSQSFAVPSSLLVKMNLPSGLKCAWCIGWDCREVTLAGQLAGKSQSRTAGSCEDTSTLVPSSVGEAVPSNPTCRIIGQTV